MIDSEKNSIGSNVPESAGSKSMSHTVVIVIFFIIGFVIGVSDVF